MALRFRRSVRLAPGLRLNFGKRSMSLSAGVRGASVSVGRRGTYTNVGITGTGLSVRERVSGGGAKSSKPRKSSRPSQSNKANLSIITRLNDDGSVQFLDSNNNLLSDDIIRIVKRQQGETIRQWLSDQCDKINHQIETLETIHLKTLPPERKPVYSPELFMVEEPLEPVPKPLGILGRLFKSIRVRIENENIQAMEEYKQKHQEWELEKASFEDKQRQRKILIEERIYSDIEAMQEFLGETLQAIEWPRETNVSFEVDVSGTKVFADVDLPEIDDFPRQTASLPSRGWNVLMKALSDSKVRQLYMAHVHGIGFRLIGEIFSTLPTVTNITLSAYSQRPNKATGVIEDEYLYSVQLQRDTWCRINFNNLSAIDIVEAFTQFDLRRKMTKTGIFTQIEPFAST